MRYYVDTCVWIDFVEGKEYAEELFADIIKYEDTLLISDLVSKEFLRYKDYNSISLLLAMFQSKGLLEHIDTYSYQEGEALTLSLRTSTPKPDALHAILARDNDAILLTKDKHFLKLKDICRIRLL